MTDQPQNLRGLKALVGIMGVLIVIGTTVVAGTIIRRVYASYFAPAPMSQAAPLSPPAGPSLPPPPISLPAGEHVQGIAAAGPDLAVWTSGPSGERILLINPATGGARTALQGGPAPRK